MIIVHRRISVWSYTLSYSGWQHKAEGGCVGGGGWWIILGQPPYSKVGDADADGWQNDEEDGHDDDHDDDEDDDDDDDEDDEDETNHNSANFEAKTSKFCIVIRYKNDTYRLYFHVKS